MTAKQFKGKAIYNPSGKAGEYSQWACNLYIGCSNDCSYCYCKRGVMSSVWSTEPKLKSCFRNEDHALELFEKELKQNLSELREHGLFFSFTTDPMLSGMVTIMTSYAVGICLNHDVPVKILSKCATRGDYSNLHNRVFNAYGNSIHKKDLIAFGFTITGHDELEQSASTNKERIETMASLHRSGYKTFASIEPIIDFDSSWKMIFQTGGICDLYKIGLMSNKKYSVTDAQNFINNVISYTSDRNSKVYFKDGLLEQAGIKRENLPSVCVTRDYNIFK
ncbi:hypothetical protein D0T53_11105 [Dysgonomonas sp. 216]|uniref:hypothetical protein n=1 Tax=Dysgonomonas sp. 216 TaxID=2302934 RepID=UPI0013CF86CE|nr:hypothetical protein [Dysgonomonas sp. 216]NDW19452.1 hypothetical protein [Dysgonomonas sp. 216]